MIERHWRVSNGGEAEGWKREDVSPGGQGAGVTRRQGIDPGGKRHWVQQPPRRPGGRPSRKNRVGPAGLEPATKGL